MSDIVASLAVEIGANIGGLRTGLRQADNEVNGISGRLQSAGQSITAFGTQVTQAFAPLTVAMGAGLYVASSFEGIMAEIEARAGLTSTELAEVSAFALQMGADTSFSAQQAAEGLLQLMTSGQTVQEAMKTLPLAMDAAAASGEDLGMTADMLTDIMAAFGLPINRLPPALQEAAAAMGLTAEEMAAIATEGDPGVTALNQLAAVTRMTNQELLNMMQMEDAASVVNSLAQAAGASSADIASLGQGFANVGPVAHNMGLSVNETAAALAILSENGVKGAESGTALKSMLLNMTRTTEATTGAWNALGTSFYDAQGNIRPLPEVLADINAGLADKTPQEANEILKDLFGSYGIVAGTALLGSISIDEMTASMAEQASASEVANARLDTFSGRVESLMGSLETLAITVLTPLMENTLQPLIETLTGVVNGVTDWANQNPFLASTLTSIAGALAVAGPLLVGIGMSMSALSILVSPAGLLIMGLGAIVALLSNPDIQAGLGAWAGIFTNLGVVVDYVINQQVLPAVRSIESAINGIAESVAAGLEGLKTTIQNALDWIRENVLEPFEDAVNDIAGALNSLGVSAGGDDPAGYHEAMSRLGSGAVGGYAPAGGPILVGEQGPELFWPNSGGMITPNHRLGGGSTIVVNAYGQSPHELAKMIEMAMRERDI